ncbi:hypothetical protein P4679_23180 [Priestia megaterium]|uniref:hypothetical protein n=1 Tax=Priestia megaterium TaxID=1404 RepID=UPI002E238030|nr:hypothetical protein [Priestia megaterium]
MSKEMQKVILHLDPIEVIVEKGKTENELIENAKKAVREQLKEKFPSAKYSLVDMNALSLESVKPGMVVEVDNQVGIVTVVNKKKINVVISGNRIITGTPEAFKASKKTFKEAMVPRRLMVGMEDYYCEGDCGYISYQGEKIPVIVGKQVRGKSKLWNLEKPGVGYELTQEQLVKFFKDIN